MVAEKQLGDVRLIMIDVERHEDYVLRRARKLLESQKPIILMEMNIWYDDKRGESICTLFENIFLTTDWHLYRLKGARKSGCLERISDYSRVEAYEDVILCQVAKTEELHAATKLI